MNTPETNTKKGGIAVDTEHIFPIIKKWLYSEKDIFLREIVSNAADAITKLKRLESLGIRTSEDEAYKITVTLDTDAKTLTVEDNGIGRPSTSAQIISIIISRKYVKRDGKSLTATELGEVTTKFMRDNFPEIVDYEFTASMESQLDSIENQENTVIGVLSGFYGCNAEEQVLHCKARGRGK